MISSTSSHSSSPCGCGGSHGTPSSSSSGCGCGGHCGCGTADCRDGAIVRPLFFAGQLLTEEDLQALSGYVAAKSRLHNHNLFGEGVACGFEVVCHPCGGGKVIVRPGHALDCCGNDIVLSAAQTLDVNALVRELRKKLQGGIDCGDPCAKPGEEKIRQRYCLYVHYCESQTDPVSAFVTDEPCGTAACEPTRVREGLRFELRCREKAKPPADALCRIASCLGDPARLGSVIADLTAVDHIIQQSEEGIGIERKDLPFTMEDLRKSTAALQAATPDPDIDLILPTFRNLVTRMDVVRVNLDRLNKLNPRPDIPTDIKVAEALDEAATRIGEFVRLHLTDPSFTALEQSFTRRVVELAGTALGTATGTTPQLWTIPDITIPRLTNQLDLMLCSLLDRLRDRLNGSPEVTICQLRREVRDLAIPCPPPASPIPPPPPVFAITIDRAKSLRDAWWHAFQECICPSLLPPCPPCDDLGVLLACLEVESCEVVRICNLERTIVPTPVALRHWLPFQFLSSLAAALCCRDLGHLELSQLVAQVCPSVVDPRKLREDLARLWQLIVEHEPQGLPFGPTAFHPPLAGPAPAASLAETVSPPAPVFDQDALVRTVTERLDEKARGALAGLRRELEEQAAKNAELEKRLKALEGRKKS
jgi:hypothetical protein